MLFERRHGVTDHQLRQFAGALLVFTLIVVLRAWWRHGSIGALVTSLSCASGAAGILGIAVPRSIRWLFSTVTTVTLPIGLVVSEAILIVLYFGVITPIALALRVVGRDPLDRSIDREAATYWVQHREVGDASRYFRQS